MLEICRLSDHKETKLMLSYDSNHKYINGVEYKLCSDCNKWLPLTCGYFYKNKSAPDNFNPYCKECTKIRSQKRNDENREWYISYLRSYSKDYEQRPERIIKKRENIQIMKEKGTFIYKEWQQNNKDKLKTYAENRSNKKHEIDKKEWNDCKRYFDNSCAYCGIGENEAKEKQGQYLHKEHVDHNGANDLSNCVPACKSCNSSKGKYELSLWYNENNKNFIQDRYEKIIKWLNEDYKLYFKPNN